MDKLKGSYFIYERQVAKVVDLSQITINGEVDAFATIEVLNEYLNCVAYIKLLPLTSIKEFMFYKTLQAIDLKMNGNTNLSNKKEWQ